MIGELGAVLGQEHGARLRRSLLAMTVYGVLQGLSFAMLVPVLRALLSGEAVGPWLAAFAVVVAATAVASYVQAQYGYAVGLAALRTLYHRLGDHVAGLPVGWFSADRVGRLGQLVGKGVMDVMSVPAHLLQVVVSAVAAPATVLVCMFVFDWRLGLAALLTAPFLWLAFRWTQSLVQRSDTAMDDAGAEGADRVVEFARQQPSLRAFGRTADGYDLLDDALARQRSTLRRLLRTTLPGLGTVALTVQLAFTAILIVGCSLALGGAVDVPELVGVLVLAVRFTEPLLAAADVGGELRMARGSLRRVKAVLDTPPLPATGTARPGEPSIELDDVGFSYAERPVLRDVSFTVAPRTVTALVGPSGSGKTTLTRLIARFWDADAGAVRVSGNDVRDYTPEDLMAQLSIVFQDVYLFEGTLEDNIRLGRPEATDEEVREAGRLARVDEIAERLPGGWQARIGEAGATLSGGERQRVSIARAMLKDAPIVLLDEATAALDPENESALIDALATLARDRTLLVIAHRLTTIAAADQIVMLEDGAVVERGTHRELLDLDGRYAAFWTERRRARGWRLTQPA
ncbi:ABC transporter ATP-binding protein [Nonomuraea sp. KC401]|uniref:ABC transporter ATP-binding protein n=1 Tax=unclassified Nonomuraea TaxID=2593643 RepID=UPI0010FD362B|nr:MULTISPECIES: ABC transporter ATP-binding protein [unclassified Nonomuraea]NBE97297.1 ATP-binding cassette domain-containing protein [Nonomuraea sp. K271]TLF54230.1 ABC transporter ATP-binding protein [Nonomuraea sp. KC401]